MRSLAERYCQGLRSKDYLSECLSILHGVEGCTRYMRDPRTIEFVKAPYVTAREILSGRRAACDCDDLASLLASLNLAAGAQVRLVTVAFDHMFFRGRRQYSHIYCEVKEPKSGTWIACDPVAGPDTANMLRRVVAAKVWPVA